MLLATFEKELNVCFLRQFRPVLNKLTDTAAFIITYTGIQEGYKSAVFYL